MAVHDISLPIRPGLPTWPGSRGFRTSLAMSMADGDPANVTWLELDVHTGTHVEGPLHFIADGATVDAFEIERFVGPALVVAVGGASVTAEALEALDIPAGTDRLLLRTSNSDRWAALARGTGDATYEPDYVALTPEGAAWVAARGIGLIGTDHLSIQRADDDGETHRILMRAGVAILEGLNLADVAPGRYDLVCVPLRLVGTEAAPARAVLIDQAQ
jgi:arylformamidase